MYYEKWTYKGHVCEIEEEREPDNRYFMGLVRTPDGQFRTVQMRSRYLSRENVELWIDAGLPSFQKSPAELRELVK